MQIISNGKKLKRHEKFGKVGIQLDMTKAEQEKHKALRDELKERREKGEDVMIFDGSVILKNERDKYDDLRVKRTAKNIWLTKGHVDSVHTTDSFVNEESPFKECKYVKDLNRTQNGDLKCIYANVDCLTNKTEEISIFLDKNNIDVAFLTESNPKNNSNTDENNKN